MQDKDGRWEKLRKGGVTAKKKRKRRGKDGERRRKKRKRREKGGGRAENISRYLRETDKGRNGFAERGEAGKGFAEKGTRREMALANNLETGGKRAYLCTVKTTRTQYCEDD